MRNRPIPGSSGHVRGMTLLGDPVLHTPCEPVSDFGPELARLIEDMFATMYAANGVGLAANQVGVGLRVFVYDCPDDEDVRHLGHLVNPRLVEADGDVIRGPEGCLSLPGLEAPTPASTARSSRASSWTALRPASRARASSPAASNMRRITWRAASTRTM